MCIKKHVYIDIHIQGGNWMSLLNLSLLEFQYMDSVVFSLPSLYMYMFAPPPEKNEGGCAWESTH